MNTTSAPITRRACLAWGTRTLAALCALPSGAFAGTSSRPHQAAPPAPTGPASRILSVNGVRLHYLEWGGEAARRPTLVLLHPGMLNARAWERFGTAMSPFFRVIAPDARGHGESEWRQPYDTETLLADLHGLLTALRLGELTLCGNSMGGTLAIAYAARYPEAVRRLISVDTGAAPPPAPGSGQPAARPPLPPPLPEGPFASPGEAAAGIAPIMGRPYIEAMVSTNLKRLGDGQWAWKHDHAGVSAAIPREMADPGRWTRWIASACPALLVRGERSPALTPSMAEQMVAARPSTTLRVVPDASHFVALDQPEAFERVAREWLGV